MDFKDILLLVDNSPSCAARIDLALYLAKKHNAHLTGLYVIAHSHYNPQQEDREQKVASAGSLFSQKAAAAGVSSEWRCVDWPITGVSMAEIVNLHAYHKDLVIIGQTLSGKAGDVPADLPERLVKGSGRPVLVVPYAGSFSTVGEHVMIAWNTGRESVRALNDAMPFLEHAQQVHVLAVSSRDTRENAGKYTCDDITTHLSRHQIMATVELFAAGDILIGDVLLNTAWEQGCDLLVMGAYSYTVRGALTLGPVARHMLNHMTVPILMSH